MAESHSTQGTFTVKWQSEQSGTVAKAGGRTKAINTLSWQAPLGRFLPSVNPRRRAFDLLKAAPPQPATPEPAAVVAVKKSKNRRPQQRLAMLAADPHCCLCGCLLSASGENGTRQACRAAAGKLSCQPCVLKVKAMVQAEREAAAIPEASKGTLDRLVATIGSDHIRPTTEAAPALRLTFNVPVGADATEATADELAAIGELLLETSRKLAKEKAAVEAATKAAAEAARVRLIKLPIISRPDAVSVALAKSSTIYEPTPEEIAAEAAAIRAGWSHDEALYRWRVARTPGAVLNGKPAIQTVEGSHIAVSVRRVHLGSGLHEYFAFWIDPRTGDERRRPTGTRYKRDAMEAAADIAATLETAST
jgi:hypothetical protein